MRSDIITLMQNMSTASDFVDLALNMLDTSRPDLNVLQALADEDMVREQTEVVEQSMNELKSYELQKPMSLLQLSSVPLVQASAAPSLLKSLLSSLSNLTQEQETAEANTRAALEQELQEGKMLHFRLMQEQTQLNNTVFNTQSQRELLVAGVQHVRKLHGRLQEQSSSLRIFLRLMGASHTNNITAVTTKADNDDQQGLLRNAKQAITKMFAKTLGKSSALEKAMAHWR